MRCSKCAHISTKGDDCLKKDVLDLSCGLKPSKIPSKETLNNYELLLMASGIDPYENTQAAYLKAYENLGIDIINRLPENNFKTKLCVGESQTENEEYKRAHLGFYDTFCRYKYPYKDVEDFFAEEKFRLDYDKLTTPVPHKMNLESIKRKTSVIGDIGLYYYMYYTTLFMWGVEWLGWDIFMTAAALEPELFDEYFLNSAFEESKKALALLSDIDDNPFVFIHDDLANALGPVFKMDWYEKYIFPKYKELFKIAKSKGKKIIFTADGNMEQFFDSLLYCGIDGVMFENPATNFEKIIHKFYDKIVIGGIETNILTFQSPKDVKTHTKNVIEQTKGLSGFAISSCGGLHGNIPIEQLVAYFDTRAEYGITKENWRNN